MEEFYIKKKRMRTIKESLELLKQIDPATAITYNFLRCLCDRKDITIVKVGRKFLLNFDELLVYLGIEE